MVLNKNHERYLKWKLENPDVLKLIKDRCILLTQRNKRFSLRLVIANVRFNEYFEDYRDKPYRISDHHTPYIARELLEEYPAMSAYIRTKLVEGEGCAI